MATIKSENCNLATMERDNRRRRTDTDDRGVLAGWTPTSAGWQAGRLVFQLLHRGSAS
jgi:hypothetical protein